MFSARIISSRGSGYLPEFRRGHPFCFALDSFVVVIVDVFLYGRVQVVERLEFRLMAVEHLVLEGPEERFHDAVVDAQVVVRSHPESDVFEERAPAYAGRREIAPPLFVLADAIKLELPIVFHEKYPFPVLSRIRGTSQ